MSGTALASPACKTQHPSLLLLPRLLPGSELLRAAAAPSGRPQALVGIPRDYHPGRYRLGKNQGLVQTVMTSLFDISLVSSPESFLNPPEVMMSQR